MTKLFFDIECFSSRKMSIQCQTFLFTARRKPQSIELELVSKQKRAKLI